MSSVNSGGPSGVTSGGVIVGNFSPPVFRPHDMRAQFPDMWAAWCRENFRNSVHLADAFDVSEKTGRLWIGAAHGPQGWAVGAAMQGQIKGAAPFVPALRVAA